MMARDSAFSSRTYADHWKEHLRIPRYSGPAPQDAEWCEIREKGDWRALRFHDYGAIYERPGLYDYLFYDLLQCDSPRRVVALLTEVAAELPLAGPMRVIDFGAGNGLVGAELRQRGARDIIGIDILPEAKAAAQRDMPGVYRDYVVADMNDPSADVVKRIRALRPNVLTCVAALGFGDIPPRAYHRTAAFVQAGGLLAFNIKEDFLDARYTYGFSELIRRAVQEKYLRVEATRRYRHRLSATGEPIYYTAIVATKLAELPESLLIDER